jgi:hypothetical protein
MTTTHYIILAVILVNALAAMTVALYCQKRREAAPLPTDSHWEETEMGRKWVGATHEQEVVK